METKDTWLWGHHAVCAALDNPNRKTQKILATRNAIKKLPNLGRPVEETDPKTLDRLLPPGAVHQGVAIQCEPLGPISIEELIDRAPKSVAILDQVSDPHNLGAIFRSAAAFGFGGLLLQTRNAPLIGGTVAKAAVGAVERVPECRVVNISRALEQLGAAGYHVVGLDGGGASDISTALAGARRLAIVLGAEGPGLRPGVAKACSELAHIPIQAQMESLNVSNAAAIAFYETARALQEG